MKLVAVKAISELSDRKQPLNKRQLGHRLLFSLIQQCGEYALNEDRSVLRMLMAVVNDTSFKIRSEGARFMKFYLASSHEKLRGTPRLEETYVPEVCYLCNDEDIHIRIDAIEALSYVLDVCEVEMVEREFTPPMVKLFASEHEEIQVKMSKIVG